ncbi:MAG: class I SAM-dependent methyltransferase [Solobacterium sp.]|nr:class I SAM-dependent methyltransferase [Solobacterium sp.]
MKNVSRTLFIPLYGKARVSRQGIILHDPDAERIWAAEAFPFRGRAKSKWLAYNMAMRARVFDDWTEAQLKAHPDALVLHAGCGLDSRFHRIRQPYREWIDGDLAEVIAVRRQYYADTGSYHMQTLDVTNPDRVRALPHSPLCIVVMEGLSMYLTETELRAFLQILREKYTEVHILMDIYTGFGARASRHANPVNETGVSKLYGFDDIGQLLQGTGLRFTAEHTFTPDALVRELKPAEQAFFRLLFTGKAYGKIYRLIELSSC